MNRCVRDIFGYCTGSPKLTSEDQTHTFVDFGGHKYTQTIPVVRCTHNPLTCKWYITSNQAILRYVREFPHHAPKALHHMLSDY